MESKEELAGALRDVRKAYRLLYFFQRRVLSVIDQLRQTLGGRRFYRWLPSGDDEAIMAASNPFDRSDLKMIPLWDASFLFLPPDGDPHAQAKGQWLLEVLVSPDDGYPEDDARELRPADFKDPVECRSTIYLCAIIALKDMERNWYSEIYLNTEWPKEDGVPETRDDVCVVGLTVDLSILPDYESIESVGERFREVVRAAGGLA
ncbi:MAG: hypothetical protein ABSF98_02210 [Bryobacteraceae bacterium]